MRREERNGIKLLERAAGDEVAFGGAGKEEEREGIDAGIANLDARFSRRSGFKQRIEYTSYRMQHARTTHDQAYTWLSCEVSICTGGVSSCLFVPESNESNSEFDGLFCDLNHRNANNAEDDGDPNISEAASDDVRACHGSHCGNDFCRYCIGLSLIRDSLWHWSRTTSCMQSVLR